MPPIPDPRMVCYTRLPTKNALRIAGYMPSALMGGAPALAIAGIVGANELLRLLLTIAR